MNPGRSATEEKVRILRKAPGQASPAGRFSSQGLPSLGLVATTATILD